MSPIPTKSDLAEARFLKSMNCSQAVLESFAPEAGLPAETARRVAAAFAGGMGMGAQCGAVTGALMVIGLSYDKIEDCDPGADQATFAAVGQMIRDFRERHGSIGCSELLGVEMATAEGVRQAEQEGFFTSRCPVFVRSATDILEQIFEQIQRNPAGGE